MMMYCSDGLLADMQASLFHACTASAKACKDLCLDTGVSTGGS